MNRKQRRAVGGSSDPAAGGAVTDLIRRASLSQQSQRLDEAASLYKRALALAPAHAQACNGLACVLLAKGKHEEASRLFARLLRLMPEIADDFAGVRATLDAVNPGPEPAVSDPLLLAILASTTVRDVRLERMLAQRRHDALRRAGADMPASDMMFCAALAQQCFINEYVFAQTEDEAAQVRELAVYVASALAGHVPVPLSSLLTLAMYVPLHSLPDAERLLERKWPAPVSDVLTQQIGEPMQERTARALIPRLTTIDDATSVAVRAQYEDNPYPRWVHAAAGGTKLSINDYVRSHCPTGAFTPLKSGGTLEVLVPGCGTGRHPIELAQTLTDCRLLAVDLSLSSLCYAKRKTPPELPITYAQGDILNLGDIGRSFDVIDASGVLHHMADPLASWRALLSLLRPGGVMRVGLYSERGRSDIVAARDFIAARGFAPTPEGIRRCRQELLSSALHGIARFGDFFSTSECRDMLFHVQERRFTLPAIKEFLREHRLRFIGFVLAPQAREHYRLRFRAHGWALSDLDRWAKIEEEAPDSFAGMYQFWVQKD